MVGSGINDSAAGSGRPQHYHGEKGSDIAMDVAKMTLISSDLNKITGKSVLQATVRTIPKTFSGPSSQPDTVVFGSRAGILYPINGFLLNPMIAGAAMAMSSVSVVSSSLRLETEEIRTHRGDRTGKYNLLEEITAPAAEQLSPAGNYSSLRPKSGNLSGGGMMCDHCPHPRKRKY